MGLLLDTNAGPKPCSERLISSPSLGFWQLCPEGTWQSLPVCPSPMGEGCGLAILKSCDLGTWWAMALFCYATVQLEGFSISHPSQWADLFTPCNPTKGSTQTLPVILYSPCDPPVFPPKWVESQGGYKILILSTQVKQDKVHRILITPLQSHSKLHWKIPVFSLQCFNRNGWNHRGIKKFKFNLPFSFITHWDGRETEKILELYCSYKIFLPSHETLAFSSSSDNLAFVYWPVCHPPEWSANMEKLQEHWKIMNILPSKSYVLLFFFRTERSDRDQSDRSWKLTAPSE